MQTAGATAVCIIAWYLKGKQGKREGESKIEQEEVGGMGERHTERISERASERERKGGRQVQLY